MQEQVSFKKKQQTQIDYLSILNNSSLSDMVFRKKLLQCLAL